MQNIRIINIRVFLKRAVSLSLIMRCSCLKIHIWWGSLNTEERWRTKILSHNQGSSTKDDWTSAVASLNNDFLTEKIIFWKVWAHVQWSILWLLIICCQTGSSRRLSRSEPSKSFNKLFRTEKYQYQSYCGAVTILKQIFSYVAVKASALAIKKMNEREENLAT